jgi:ABC-type nickel/cobalt efflux system permease component RcnA
MLSPAQRVIPPARNKTGLPVSNLRHVSPAIGVLILAVGLWLAIRTLLSALHTVLRGGSEAITSITGSTAIYHKVDADCDMRSKHPRNDCRQAPARLALPT